MTLSPSLVRLKEIEDYHMAGQKCYRRWLGYPLQQPSLEGVLEWIRYEASTCVNVGKRIAEIHPNGGRWTHVILQLMYDNGFPVSTVFDIFGTLPEHNLTMRDSIRLLDRRASYNKELRLRTFRPFIKYPGDGPIISSLRFQAHEMTKLKEPSFKHRFDTIYCLDNVKVTREIVLYASHLLKATGTFICEIPKDDYGIMKAMCFSHNLSIIANLHVGSRMYLRIVLK